MAEINVSEILLIKAWRNKNALKYSGRRSQSSSSVSSEQYLDQSNWVVALANFGYLGSNQQATTIARTSRVSY